VKAGCNHNDSRNKFLQQLGVFLQQDLRLHFKGCIPVLISVKDAMRYADEWIATCLCRQAGATLMPHAFGWYPKNGAKNKVIEKWKR
jgi:hypothetical protein